MRLPGQGLSAGPAAIPIQEAELRLSLSLSFMSIVLNTWNEYINRRTNPRKLERLGFPKNPLEVQSSLYASRVRARTDSNRLHRNPIYRSTITRDPSYVSHNRASV